MSLFGGSDETSEGGPINVVAQLRAKSGHEDELRSALAKLAGPSQKEPGCLKYEVFEDVYYTGSFYTQEVWESEAALDTHLATNKRALNQAKALLREDFRTSILKPVK